MAHLFKSRTTAYYLDGRRVPKGTPGAKRRLLKSVKWYGKWKEGGRWRSKALSADKARAQSMLAALTTDAERGSVGLGNPYVEPLARPLADHLEDFRRTLEARGRTPRH